MLGDFGSNVCPAGTAGIGTEVACQSGVATLGFVYVRSLSNSGFPKGCYGNGTHAWLNAHAMGSASATRQRICAGASAPIGPVASCNDTMFVYGLAGDSLFSRMGYYYLVEGLVQGGRPVYKYEPAVITVYLFYWASSGRWLIGSDYTSSAASLRAQSSAACPDAATGWQVFSTSVWTNTTSVVVTAGRSKDRLLPAGVAPLRPRRSLRSEHLINTGHRPSPTDRAPILLAAFAPFHDPVSEDAPAVTAPVFSSLGRYLQPLHRRVGSR